MPKGDWFIGFFGSVFAVCAVSVVATGQSALAFDLQGHRGARGLAPENTLAAFEAGIAIGVTTLELDLAMTRDGVLVVSHNPALNPDITRFNGMFIARAEPNIRDMTFAELARYDVGRIKPDTAYARAFPQQAALDGAAVPKLSDVLALAASNKAIRFNIETKITPSSGTQTPSPEIFTRSLVDTIRTAGVGGRVSIQSFDWRTLKIAADIAPEIPRVCLTSEHENFNTVQDGFWTAGLQVKNFGGSVPKLVAAQGCSTWSPQFRDVSAQRVAEAKGLGLKVIPWTVNEVADAERLIDMAVDGLITDYPDRMVIVVRQKGLTVD